MNTFIVGFLMAIMLVSSLAKPIEKNDPRSIAEAIQAGSWNIYIVYLYWKGEKENAKLTAGLQTEVVQKFGDQVFYGEVDCSGNDYHPVLDLFEFADPRDNFKGRSVHLEELPMVLSIVHGVGYVSHGETSYKLIAEKMPELQDYATRRSVQRAY